ncbi:ROK family transcriptional regulator [Devosia sp.]|jgi:predicted NBD/HSP70 family sugar kinase|uniref:ROK family transcriptional regulator n=2 Tax=unclassified Devosia TaxID=196773 RepID=UPI001AD3C2E9|nr:ROK family transcriptional regulator [Devosia sp.]MBN9364780.1 ROK family transcriptional regulator [Devosia sp.]
MRITTPRWTPGNGATRAVALEVLIHGPLSRSEVARRLDLSPGSLTRLSTPLLESGLLVEAGEQVDGKVGRPQQLLDVVPASRRFIGMKLMADEVVGVTTDLRANVLASQSRRLTDRSPDAVADIVADLARALAAGTPEVMALGIGIGGFLGEQGQVLSAPFLGWQDVPLGLMIETRTGIPTMVENDLVAFTEYEHWFGAGRGLDRFAVVTLGAGVGYGLVIHDEIVRNDEFGIGLVGHWPLDPFGPVCSEGHRGCAKAVLTDTAITHAVSQAIGRPVSYPEALDLAASGEPAARRVVDDAGRGLGRLLAAIANLTMPETVVLGGEGVRLAEVAAAAIDTGLRADRDPRTRPIPLTIRSGENIEWCRGAAVVAIQTFVLGRRTAET